MNQKFKSLYSIELLYFAYFSEMFQLILMIKSDSPLLWKVF